MALPSQVTLIGSSLTLLRYRYVAADTPDVAVISRVDLLANTAPGPLRNILLQAVTDADWSALNDNISLSLNLRGRGSDGGFFGSFTVGPQALTIRNLLQLADGVIDVRCEL